MPAESKSPESKIRIFFAAPLFIPDIDRPVKISELLSEVLGDHDANIAIHGEQDEASPAINTSVFQDINRADLVVADITRSNPNVMYEVGYAHALRKPVVLLTEKSESKIPADLAGTLVIVYDPANPETLRQHLRLAVERYLPVVAA